MKKIIAVTLTALMLFMPAVAMHVDEADTTRVWINHDEFNMYFDTFLLLYEGEREVSMMQLYGVDDGSAEWTLNNNPIYINQELAVICRGWAGLRDGFAIDSYGYKINEGKPVYKDEFKQGAEPAVYANGGDSRYRVTVPVAGKTRPSLITITAKDVYGNEYDLIEFSVNGNYTGTETVFVSADGATREIKAKAGEKVDVQINVESNTTLSSLKVKVDWPKQLQLVNAVYGFDTSKGVVTAAEGGWENAGNSYEFAWSGTGDTIEGDFTFVTLTFRVSSHLDAVTHLPVSVELTADGVSSVTGEEIQIDSMNGGIKADPADKGDVNCDGEIDNKDVVTLFRYVSGAEYDIFSEYAANVNEDEDINNKDVTELFRYILDPPEKPTEPTETPAVLGITDIGGKFLVYGSAEPDSVIRTVYQSGSEVKNVCNNKYFYIEVPVNTGDRVSFFATAPGKLESEELSVVMTPEAYGGNVWGGRNSRIFYAGTYGFLTDNHADMDSLAGLKGYIANKTIKDIQAATGKDTKLIYAIIPDPATAYYDEQNDDVYVPLPLNTAMQSFVSEIDGCHEDVYALDLLSVMRAHKDQRIYFSTDTHYTELGAYYVYLEIMDTVRKAYPSTTVKTLDNGDYTLEYYDVPGGDMCGMAGLGMNEVVPFFIANFEDTGTYYVSKRNDGIKSAGFGPSGWERNSELANSSNPTVYFLGDSYGCYILPFIGANFSKVWTNEGVLWSYNLDKSILEENKPDYVILLVCQRNVGPNFLGNLISDFSFSVSAF